MHRPLADQVLELRAALLLQSAEIQAMFFLLRATQPKTLPPDAPSADLAEQFVQLRTAAAQSMLLAIEDKDPPLAAQLQKLLDASCRQFPLW